MSTSCQVSPTPLPTAPAAGNPLSSRWPFTRLQQLVASARFVSVDLADNILVPPAAKVDVGPLPPANRPESARLMSWRFD